MINKNPHILIIGAGPGISHEIGLMKPRGKVIVADRKIEIVDMASSFIHNPNPFILFSKQQTTKHIKKISMIGMANKIRKIMRKAKDYRSYRQSDLLAAAKCFNNMEAAWEARKKLLLTRPKLM